MFMCMKPCNVMGAKISSAPASRTMRLTLLATSTARNCPDVVPFARGGTAL